MAGCGPLFLVQCSNCRVTEVKGEYHYQQEDEKLDNVEEEEELDHVMEVDVIYEQITYRLYHQ